jgi:hypothetical protein
MRQMLLKNGIHDFPNQSQGPEGKKVVQGYLLYSSGPREVQISLYRPKTKDGDPRMWFSRLGEYASSDDVLAVFILKGKIYALNLSSIPLAKEKDSRSALGTFFGTYWAEAVSVADELLGLLRNIAAVGPLRATCTGSTAVGRCVETALGIATNSSQNPDYKGIEIKSGRSSLTGRTTRSQLFACVPDWTLSNLKSSEAILEKYGYVRDDILRLYCTVSSRKANSQGLKLTVDGALRWLREVAGSDSVDVAIWPMTKLESRLSKKHPETFWIKARAEFIRGVEHFHLQTVTHTRNPNLPQLERMLADGTITVDHAIKRDLKGRIREKGPLFKIEPRRIRELFLGEPKQYSLIA